MTLAKNCKTPPRTFNKNINGIGFMEPKEALEKYHRAFSEIVNTWKKHESNASDADIEMCNNYTILRYSLNINTPAPSKFDRREAELFMKGIVFAEELGM